MAVASPVGSAPKSSYDADDVGKHLIQGGIEKVVELQLHAGHSRVVTMQKLANGDSALDAAGTEITTGGAGDFRGFHHRSRQVSPSTDGSWYASITGHDFEIQDEAMTHTSERWDNYNPFEEDAPWESVLDENGDTINHTSFTFEDGTVDDWRIVQSEQHAKNAATAVGEAFFTTDVNSVLMCVAFTAHLDDEVKYRAVTYRPPRLGNPMAEWWGEGQTERLADPADVTWLNQLWYRLTFKQSAPDDHWDGGDEMGVEMLEGADAPNYDLISRDSAGEVRGDFKVLKLPPGRFRVIVQCSHGLKAAVTGSGISAFDVLAATDDLLIRLEAGYGTVVQDPFGSDTTDTRRVSRFEEVMEQTTERQLTFIMAVQAALGTDDRDVTFYALVEQLS